MDDPAAAADEIAALCGGVGAARFLQGAIHAGYGERLRAIVNVGDDCIMHGLHISPDLDSILYTLAGRHDEERGWGQRNETWNALDALADLGEETWFRLGDRDMATHIARTAKLAAGESLTGVTESFARKLGLACPLLPVTNDRVETRVALSNGTTVSFQEYFVKLRHEVEVTEIAFHGIDQATATDSVISTLESADTIVICPSNPLLSIDPILGVPTANGRKVRDILLARRDKVVAISPLVAGRAVKGPAARLFRELNLRPDCVGVAEHYQDLVGTFVIDSQDAELADKITALSMRCIVTNTMMTSTAAAADLARAVIDRRAI